MDKIYDRAALIQAYIDSKQTVHEDIKWFYPARLAALEQAFDVQIRWKGVKNDENSELFMLFNSTVSSYRSIQHPGSGFLETGGLASLVIELGEQVKPMMAAWDTIVNANNISEQAHLVMLDELFKLLWGEITMVVTSDQLRELGFDDSQEPDWLDYY